jgi:ribosome-associated heat shock protein Hsp15
MCEPNGLRVYNQTTRRRGLNNHVLFFLRSTGKLMTAQANGQRLDKWLWFSRMLKSRTLAADLVSAGKVRVNGERVTKPSQTVKPGDTLTFVLHERPRVLEVVAGGDRRGPALEAQALYKDLSPPPVPRPLTAPAGQRDAGAGRPTKRDRRDMDKWRDTGD